MEESPLQPLFDAHLYSNIAYLVISLGITVIILMKVPDRKEIQQRQLFQLASIVLCFVFRVVFYSLLRNEEGRAEKSEEATGIKTAEKITSSMIQMTLLFFVYEALLVMYTL